MTRDTTENSVPPSPLSPGGKTKLDRNKPVPIITQSDGAGQIKEESLLVAEPFTAARDSRQAHFLVSLPGLVTPSSLEN